MKRERLFAVALSGILITGGCFLTSSMVRAEDASAGEMKKEKEDKIAVDQLPPAVVDGVKKAMPDGKITDAEKETKDGAVVYELDVKSGDKTYEVKVAEDGKVISQKIDEEEDHEDKDKGGKKDKD